MYKKIKINWDCTFFARSILLIVEDNLFIDIDRKWWQYMCIMGCWKWSTDTELPWACRRCHEHWSFPIGNRKSICIWCKQNDFYVRSLLKRKQWHNGQDVCSVTQESWVWTLLCHDYVSLYSTSTGLPFVPGGQLECGSYKLYSFILS
jgi:hypothetical protein